jgi:endonuclease/exonuclease/phosphatase family metal-dependent hydrolase
VFLKKRSSPCLQYGGAPDGLALFYKRDVFTLLEAKTLYFSDAKKKKGATPDSQGAIIAMLERTVLVGGSEREQEQQTVRVCVATTHLKASKNDEGESMRERQATQLLDEVQTFMAAFQQAELEKQNQQSTCLPSPPPVYVFVAGDMNAAPHDAAEYKALAYPAVMQHALDVYSAYGGGRGVQVAGDNNDDEEKGGKESESESYAVSKDPKYEPPFTTWKFRPNKMAKHTIDYIFFKRTQALTPAAQQGGEVAAAEWYRGKQVVVHALLDIPTEVQIGTTGLPTRRLASDHVDLMASFSLG